jgi:hypothetical protein
MQDQFVHATVNDPCPIDRELRRETPGCHDDEGRLEIYRC